MNLFNKYFKGRTIIVTGHTGFKGSWLTLWLIMLGAKVIGISNGLISKPSHFEKLKLKKKIKHINLDIRNVGKLKKIFKKNQPDYVFHLAAQSLVKTSFEKPYETFTTNTVGTLNILESLLQIKKKCHAVIITSDKSYKNLELKRGYKENDLLGGDDPYSGSKGSAELILNSYFNSVIINKKNLSLNIVRAGNVIGGGDWSKDRIIPDCIKSWSKNKKAIIRNPNSTRPWQHILEVIRAYMQLAILGKKNKNNINGEAFNIGPKNSQNRTVIELVKSVKKNWNIVKWKIKTNKKDRRESKLLKLNSNKSKNFLSWEPILNFQDSVKLTTIWYRSFYSKINPFEISKKQILEYEKKLNKYFSKKKIKRIF